MLFVCFVYEKLTFFFVCYLVCNFCFPSTWVSCLGYLLANVVAMMLIIENHIFP